MCSLRVLMRHAQTLVQAGLISTESDSLRLETDEGPLQIMLNCFGLLAVRDD